MMWVCVHCVCARASWVNNGLHQFYISFVFAFSPSRWLSSFILAGTHMNSLALLLARKPICGGVKNGERTIEEEAAAAAGATPKQCAKRRCIGHWPTKKYDRSALTHRWASLSFLAAVPSELTCFNFLDLLSACATSIHNQWPEIRFDATDTNLLTRFMSVSPSLNFELLLLLAFSSSSLGRSHSSCPAQLSLRFFLVVISFRCHSISENTPH